MAFQAGSTPSMCSYDCAQLVSVDAIITSQVTHKQSFIYSLQTIVVTPTWTHSCVLRSCSNSLFATGVKPGAPQSDPL